MEHQSTAGPAPGAKPALPRFAVGQVWERRDGAHEAIARFVERHRFVTMPGGVWYWIDGGGAVAGGQNKPNPLDLVRLVSEPEAADPWPRERRALAAGLRVQCRHAAAAALGLPWHTIEDSTKHLLKGNGGGSWADPNYTFRVDPRDEPAMQAIERGERVDYPVPPEAPALPINTAANTDYEVWLAARPARLAARKPLAVGAARFNAFAARGRDPIQLPDMSGVEVRSTIPFAPFGTRLGVDEKAGILRVHNPDARMATVPPGHERGMP